MMPIAIFVGWILFSGLVIVVALDPLRRLKMEQEREYVRIFGNGLWFLSVGSLTWYLVAGDYRRNISSDSIVKAFKPALWMARLQCIGLVGVIIVYVLQSTLL